MRLKIIIVNAGIVAIVAVLSFVLLATGLKSVVSDPAARKSEVERTVRSANAQLELDGLLLERWLAEQAARKDVREVFTGGTERARADSATAQADKIRDLAMSKFARLAPSMVLLVDAQGVALGRNGSALMRGDKMAEAYPSLGESLKSGHTASDVWLNRQRQEQLLANYAPVRGDDGAIAGALVMGTPLNDERLSRTSDLTSGRAIAVSVAAAGGKQLEIISKSDQASGDLLNLIQSGTVAEAAAATLGSGGLSVLTQASKDYVVAAAPLEGYGSGSAALVAAVPASLVASMTTLLWPVFAVGALGILLVIAGGVVLGNYISQPIAEMEEGLLQIMNGKTDLRFQLEHEDLGGLIFRINSLLNALMGVPETDEEGRTSAAPQEPYQE
jgi:hypothetical protein